METNIIRLLGQKGGTPSWDVGTLRDSTLGAHLSPFVVMAEYLERIAPTS